MAIGLQTVLVNQIRLPSIREAQSRLLVSLSRTEDIATATEEHIRGLAGGQTPHRYAALSLGFRLAVEEKRRNPSAVVANPIVPPLSGPTLQCRNPDCSQGGLPVLVRVIGRRRMCQTCGSLLVCCVCGSRRHLARLSSCNGCKRKWN